MVKTDNVAYLFSGQGSQYAGMGRDIYEAFPESKAIFQRADKALGFSLSGVCFNASPDALKQTIFSQPAILTMSIAAYEAFKARMDIMPRFMAGLSLGEYSALIASGSLNFEEGLKLVRKRAEIMEEATQRYPGKMAAVIGLALGEIKNACAKSGAEIANLNTPEQTVITGKPEAVKQAGQACLAAGAKRVIELEVSGAFHSSLMFEASMEFKVVVERTPFTDPQVPVVSNYTAQPQYKTAAIMENLAWQMRSSVRWEESMRFLLSQGVTRFYEFGPGKVLKGLMRKIDSSANVVSIEKKEDVLNLEVI